MLVSRFNAIVTDRLRQGAHERLTDRGVSPGDIETVTVPGAWELPLAAKIAAESGFEAIVALGCVVRGETAHFELVWRAAAEGLARVQEETGVPVGQGLLTPENLEQGMARSGGVVGNAGASAADAALEMAELREKMRSQLAPDDPVEAGKDQDRGPKAARARGTRHAHSRARSWALQILYAWDLSGRPANLTEFARRELSFRRISARYRPHTERVLRLVEERLDQIDRILEQVADNWRIERMGAIDRNVIRIGMAELFWLDEVPPAVAIDEAVNLAERYGGKGSPRFVNGILDAARKRGSPAAPTAAGSVSTDDNGDGGSA